MSDGQMGLILNDKCTLSDVFTILIHQKEKFYVEGKNITQSN